jgi:hypothetical protein
MLAKLSFLGQSKAARAASIELIKRYSLDEIIGGRLKEFVIKFICLSETSNGKVDIDLRSSGSSFLKTFMFSLYNTVDEPDELTEQQKQLYIEVGGIPKEILDDANKFKTYQDIKGFCGKISQYIINIVPVDDTLTVKTKKHIVLTNIIANIFLPLFNITDISSLKDFLNVGIRQSVSQMISIVPSSGDIIKILFGSIGQNIMSKLLELQKAKDALEAFNINPNTIEQESIVAINKFLGLKQTKHTPMLPEGILLPNEKLMNLDSSNKTVAQRQKYEIPLVNYMKNKTNENLELYLNSIREWIDENFQLFEDGIQGLKKAGQPNVIRAAIEDFSSWWFSSESQNSEPTAAAEPAAGFFSSIFSGFTSYLSSAAPSSAAAAASSAVAAAAAPPSSAAAAPPAAPPSSAAAALEQPLWRPPAGEPRVLRLEEHVLPPQAPAVPSAAAPLQLGQSSAANARDHLLAQIREGKSLRKTPTSSEIESPARPIAGQQDHSDMLKQALAVHRKAKKDESDWNRKYLKYKAKYLELKKFA